MCVIVLFVCQHLFRCCVMFRFGVVVVCFVVVGCACLRVCCVHCQGNVSGCCYCMCSLFVCFSCLCVAFGGPLCDVTIVCGSVLCC